MENDYQNLLEECREIITECEFTSRWALVEGYHLLGERINKEKSVTVTQLAKDLNRSERTIQCAIKFAKKYPILSQLPAGKNVSWHQIVNKYLPEGPIKERKTTCPKCGYQW